MAENTDASRFKHLPALVKVEDMIASHDVMDHPEEKGDDLREAEWMLRTSVG